MMLILSITIIFIKISDKSNIKNEGKKRRFGINFDYIW